MHHNINIIAATDINGVIGRNGTLPWYLPSDLKKFKELTTGNTVIMGRKTYESLSCGHLSNRQNIVVTSRNLNDPDIETAPTLLDALSLAKTPIYIIGGKRIFEEGFQYANCIIHAEIRTRIPDGDVYCKGFLFLLNKIGWDCVAEEKVYTDNLPYIRRIFFRNYG